MFAEDYVDFVKKCKETLAKIETLKRQPEQSMRKYDWSGVLQQLAEQQIVIADYMAMMAGVDDYDD